MITYANEARRNSVRDFLQAQEKKHFGTLKNIIAFQDQELKRMDKEEGVDAKVLDCRVCGEPTDDPQMLCQGCKLLAKIQG